MCIDEAKLRRRLREHIVCARETSILADRNAQRAGVNVNLLCGDQDQEQLHLAEIRNAIELTQKAADAWREIDLEDWDGKSS